MVILRAAAAVTVLLSLSFLAYQLSRQISGGIQNVALTLNDESTSPVITTPENRIIPQRNISTPSDASSTNNNSVIRASLPEIQEENPPLGVNDPDPVQNVLYGTGSDISVTERAASGRDLLMLFESADSKMKTNAPSILFTPEIAVEKKTEKWTIAALISPTYFTNFYSGNDELTSNLSSDEQQLFSYSGGFAFSYKINKRVSVQSGLYYSSFGHELSGITSFGGFQPYNYTKSDRNFEVLTTNGLVYTNNADIFLIDSRSDNRLTTRYTRDYFDPTKADLQYIDNSLRQNFGYLELPVVFRYKLIDKTIDFNLVGGLSSNLLVNNSVYAAVDGGKYQVGKTEGLNLLTFSSSLGMGMEYNISGNLSLNLEPTLRYYLNPVNQYQSLRVHPYSFGIFSGISYRF
jgi:hypothetical protein